MPTPDQPSAAPSAVSRGPFRGAFDRMGRNLLGGPGRVPGADIARGIAVLGMFTAHVGVTSDDISTLEGWLSLAHGRSSILFATVAGLSLALFTGGAKPFTGELMRTAQARILVRAVLLMALVAVLDLLDGRVLLILGFYAAYFVLALPFLRMSPARLAAMAVLVAVVGPFLAYYGPEALARAGLRAPHDGSGAATDFLLTGHYPAVVWMAYVFAGLAVGRCDLRSPALRLGLVAGGFSLAAVTSLVSSTLVAGAGGIEAIDRELAMTSYEYLNSTPPTLTDPWPPLAGLYLEGPHDDTMFEALGSGGFALGVLGLCLLVGARGGTDADGGRGRQVARRAALVVTAPLAAVGAMALTVYSAQLVVIWWWSRAGVDLLVYPDNGPLGVMVLWALAAATVWRALFGRGPLERVFTGVARKAFPTPGRVSDVASNAAPGAAPDPASAPAQKAT
jgi:uncharacterized protein